ncbi:Electron transfer flavoprotein beta subunit, partial [Globisporangium splendens]
MEERESIGDEHDSAEPQPPVIKTPKYLYDLPRQHRPELWQFVQLVPKEEFMHLRAKQLKSEHADYAYCTICKCTIAFRTGQHYLKGHMERYHLKQLLEYKTKAHADAADELVNQYTKSHQRKRKEQAGIRDEDQQQFNRLPATWIAQSLRPISLVEDRGFIELVNFVANELGGVQPVIPKRTQVRSEIVRLASELRSSLKIKLRESCLYFCISTDVWADRGRRSYLSLTLHFLDPDFNSNNWTLEVEHLPVKHTGELISSTLHTTMDRRGLNKDCCVKLLRDGASNAVSAGENLRVNHMTCVAHSLHLVVSAAMMRKKGDRTAKELLACAENEADFAAALDEEACSKLDDFLQSKLGCEKQVTMAEMRDIVQVFRSLATYFHRSSKGSHRLSQIQKDIQDKPSIGVVVDYPTRWSSTRDMLLRLKELQTPLDHFFCYLATPEGRQEFSDISLTRPTSEQWFAMKCLLVILNLFAVATELLSGDRYPTLALAFPCLRAIKCELQNVEMFGHEAALVGDLPFLTRALRLMNGVRAAVLDLFLTRFTNVDLLWVSYLDPRLTEMTHLKPDEIAEAKNYLINAAMEIAVLSSPARPADDGTSTITSPMPTPKKAKTNIYAAVFGTRATMVNGDQNSEKGEHILRTRCESEFHLYLEDTASVGIDQDPLSWWKSHTGKFPILAKLARKWLGCVATSVPSERAFSTGGNTVTAKRCSLSPDLVRDLVFISENCPEFKHQLQNE